MMAQRHGTVVATAVAALALAALPRLAFAQADSTTTTSSSSPLVIPDQLNFTCGVLLVPAMGEEASSRARDLANRYNGYAVDIAKLIALAVINLGNEGANTQVTLRFYTSETYGTRLANGTWTGVIGDLLYRNTSIAAGIFPISQELRDAGLAFSTPIITSGYSVLVKLQPKNPGFWQFLQPFHWETWLAILGLIALAATFTWISDKLSPFGFSRTESEPDARRGLNLPNSIWNGWLAILGKDTHEVKGWANRVLIIGLTFMAYFMLRAYTSSLTAILTVRDLVSDIKGVEDLRESSIPFAVVAASSTQRFFEQTTDPAYSGMTGLMRFYPTLTAGVEALRRGDVRALVSESLTLKYARLFPPCELATVGNDFAEQQLAFPFRADTPAWMVYGINTAISDALTYGQINQLYRTYFAPPASCVDVPNSVTLREGLGLTELSGIFIAGFIFMGGGFILLAIEFALWPCRNSKGCLKNINKSLGYVTDNSRTRAELAVSRFLSRPNLPAGAGVAGEKRQPSIAGMKTVEIGGATTVTAAAAGAPPLSARIASSGAAASPTAATTAMPLANGTPFRYTTSPMGVPAGRAY